MMDVYVALWLPEENWHDDPDVLGVLLDLGEAKKACQEQQDGYLSRDERVVLAWESIPIRRPGASYYDSLTPGWVADAGVGGQYFVLERTARRYA